MSFATLKSLPDVHPNRLERLIRGAIELLELDLTGAIVLTEAASRAYSVTPVIAALAGAEKVYALGQDSVYASAEEAAEQIGQLAETMNCPLQRIEFLRDRAAVPRNIDVVTNLGFVRPIDAEILGRLTGVGVVSYMCEAWEFRAADVDIAACDEARVPVAGIWEDFEGMDVFKSCGPLAAKLCFEAGIEVAGNHIILIGDDRFAPVIETALASHLAKVTRLASAIELTEELTASADAILFADYLSSTVLLGDSVEEAASALTTTMPLAGAAEIPSPTQLARWNPGLKIVQFAGCLNAEALAQAGLQVFPAHRLPPQRMAFPLHHLGIRPVVYLHAAGLKAGELLWRARAGKSIPQRFRSLLEPMNAAAETLLH